MLWSWISSLPSYNSLLSLESVKPSVSGPPLLFWPETQQHRVSDASALVSSLPFCGSPMEAHPLLSSEHSLWDLVQGEQSGSSAMGRKARLAVSRYCSGLGMLSWLGWIPWGSVSVLWSSLNWRVQLWLKVTLVSALELQVLYYGSQRTSPGEGFFFLPLILVRPGLGPLVISFTLYWLLLHCSKWLRGKG